MNKREKLDYEFTPFPRKLHPGWANAGCHVFGLCAKLFEFADGGPIEVHGTDWLESVCKQLHINGRERPNVRKTLLKLQAEGLVRPTGAGLVSVVFRPTDVLLPVAESHPSVVDRSPNVADPSSIVIDPSSTGKQSNIPLETSADNHSGHKRQTEETEETDQTYIQNAGACSAVDSKTSKAIGFDWLNSTTGCAPNPLGWERHYEALGEKPAAERALVAKHLMLTGYVREERRKAKPDHVLKYWDDFVAGPRNFAAPLKQPAKRSKPGPAPVSTPEEFDEDRRQLASGEFTW